MAKQDASKRQRQSKKARDTSNERDKSAAGQGEQRKHFGDGTRDEVDEASWESFPASDPPATTLTSIGSPRR